MELARPILLVDVDGVLMDHDSGTTLSDCPSCGAPAEVVRRWIFEAPDGPMEHVKVRSALGHWFAMPAWMLSST